MSWLDHMRPSCSAAVTRGRNKNRNWEHRSTMGLCAISMSETAYRGLERRNERRGQTEQRTSISRLDPEHDDPWPLLMALVSTNGPAGRRWESFCRQTPTRRVAT